LGGGAEVTRWAPVLRATPARERPGFASPRVVSVRHVDPGGQREPGRRQRHGHPRRRHLGGPADVVAAICALLAAGAWALRGIGNRYGPVLRLRPPRSAARPPQSGDADTARRDTPASSSR
jgi:hypothetical protein